MENEPTHNPNGQRPMSSDNLPPQASLYTPMPPSHATVFSKTNILMAGLFVAALVGLYVIHASSGPTKASAASTDIDKKLVAFLADLRKQKAEGKQQPELFDTSKFEATVRQMPPGDLLFDPFRYKPIEAESEEEAVEDPEEQARIQYQKESSEAIARVKALKIQSILMGNVPVVMIEHVGNIRAGESVAGGWEVIDIDPFQVRLKWREETYILPLE